MRGILFKPWKIKFIAEHPDMELQTRRVIKPQPKYQKGEIYSQWYWCKKNIPFFPRNRNCHFTLDRSGIYEKYLSFSSCFRLYRAYATSVMSVLIPLSVFLIARKKTCRRWLSENFDISAFAFCKSSAFTLTEII